MTPDLVRSKTIAVAMTFLAAAACKDSTAPAVPASIALDQNVVAEATVGTVLTTPPTFVVKDESGHALGGVAITETVTAGGGTLTDAPTKTKSGATPVGTWKLGNIAGINTITITVGSLAPFTISVNGKAGPPTAIVFTVGQNQQALAGTALPVAPVAQVRDAFGNAVSGVPVVFTVVDGAGIAPGDPVTSDASGNATVASWILGKSAVPQTLRASTQSGASANLTANVQTQYTVDIRFFGPPMPAAAAAMFTAAAARIGGAVVGDVPNLLAQTTPVNLASLCGVDGLPTDFTDPIDDLIIYASVGPIDGAGRVLAFSGPCAIRGQSGTVNRQTLIGVMKFDSDDIDARITNGTLTDIIQHEMLHSVGIGTLWDLFGVLQDAGTASTRYTGPFGIAGCIQIGGAPICPESVPVENLGGPGTADGHWRESVFASELMTGFVTSPTPGSTGILNPFSVMSIQSLADLGYVTNPNAADPFVIPGQSALRAFSQQLNVDQSQGWEQNFKPRAETNRQGQLVLMPRQ